MKTETKQTSNSQETRKRILDAAESLFADNGFRAVSLRQITAAAGANVAAVNYHFGGKDGLIFEVLTRVVGPINEERLASLSIAEADAGNGSVPVKQILECFFRPVIDQLGQGTHHSTVYLKLAGRCLSEMDDQSPETLLKLFREVADRFVAALEKSLPHLSEVDVFWRLHFSVGTLLHALTKGSQLVLFSGNAISSVNPEETLHQLVDFTAAGMEAAPTKKEKKKRTKQHALSLLAGSALFLASCTSVSPGDAKYHASIDIPAHWVAGKGYRPTHVADIHWTSNFGDKNLSAFVREVLSNNRDLKAASARVDIAAANARVIGADFYPQVSGGLSGRRNKQNFIGFPIAGAPPGGVISSTNNQFGLSLDLTWEIDLWGRIKAAESAAIASFEASEFDRATVELSLAGQAVKAWISLGEARDQLALTESTLSVFRNTESTIRGRFEGGLDEAGQSLASKLLLSQADIATAEDTRESQRELIGRISRQLEVLAGKYPAGRAGKTARLPSFPKQVPTDLPATLLNRRPDLAAAERRIAAADQQLLEAKRSLLPRISLSSSTGTSTEEIENLLDSNFSVWSLAGNLAQPILQGGRLRANVSKKDAELIAAAAEFEQAALTAFSDVENALAAESFFQKRITALSRAASLSSKAYSRSREEYTNGTGDLLTMLTAQQNAFSQKSRLISLRRLQLENRVDLYLALGGSFRPHSPPLQKTPSDS